MRIWKGTTWSGPGSGWRICEAETGYRSGSRYWARPGEPKPEYDPERTTLTERRRAKAAKLKKLDRQEARQLVRPDGAGRWAVDTAPARPPGGQRGGR